MARAEHIVSAFLGEGHWRGEGIAVADTVREKVALLAMVPTVPGEQPPDDTNNDTSKDDDEGLRVAWRYGGEKKKLSFIEGTKEHSPMSFRHPLDVADETRPYMRGSLGRGDFDRSSAFAVLARLLRFAEETAAARVVLCNVFHPTWFDADLPRDLACACAFLRSLRAVARRRGLTVAVTLPHSWLRAPVYTSLSSKFDAFLHIEAFSRSGEHPLEKEFPDHHGVVYTKRCPAAGRPMAAVHLFHISSKGVTIDLPHPPPEGQTGSAPTREF